MILQTLIKKLFSIQNFNRCKSQEFLQINHVQSSVSDLLNSPGWLRTYLQVWRILRMVDGDTGS